MLFKIRGDAETLHSIVNPLSQVLGYPCPCLIHPLNQQRRPCHGSEFDPSGKVIRGPAARNLTSYPTKAEDQSILVKLG